MSWTPLFQLSGNSPPIKNGNSTVNETGTTTITFSNAFADNNYTVSLTPYYSGNTKPIDRPQAYIVYDKSFTPNGFQVETLYASGFFWTAIYGSNS